MLLGTLGANLLGNMLAGKRAIATRAVKGIIRADKDTIRAFLIPFRPLTNFKIQIYCQNERKFNSVYSKK